MTRLILASQSKGRQEMLRGAGLKFEAIPADIDESAAQQSGAAPAQIAQTLAAQKALAVSEKHADALVIGSDQILEFKGGILGKAKTAEGAIDRLRDMAGNSHSLVSAVALAQGGKIIWQSTDSAILTMHALDEAFLSCYKARAGDALTQSVGGYWLEDIGAHLFKKIDGDYFTILGMPLLPLLTYLRAEHGIGWKA